jgi:uncharacterized Zn finger protein
MELKQPQGHSEYIPSGKCPNCGTFHYASYNLDNELQVNAMELSQNESIARRIDG